MKYITLSENTARKLDDAIRLALQRLGNAMQGDLSRDGAAEAFRALHAATDPLDVALAPEEEEAP